MKRKSAVQRPGQVYAIRAIASSREKNSVLDASEGCIRDWMRELPDLMPLALFRGEDQNIVEPYFFAVLPGYAAGNHQVSVNHTTSKVPATDRQIGQPFPS